VPGPGTLTIRIVIDGTAILRLVSPYGPLIGTPASLSPDPAESPRLPGLRASADAAMQLILSASTSIAASPCSGVTDADGQVVLDHFPPGPATLQVPRPNSRYAHRVTVPEGAREILVAIPDGLMPVLVTNAVNKRPVGNAAITWSSGGARIEARAVASGDALLEGVGATSGTLVVEAPGYARVEGTLSEPSATIFEVPLLPAPPSLLQPRVLTGSGEPVPFAVVTLTPQHPLDVPEIAVADTKGIVTLFNLLPGALQLSVSADGFATEVVSVPENGRNGIALMLSRGYRATVDVDVPSAGLYLVRIVSETGASVEDRLDLTSARSVESPGQLSLGPLAPGTYVIELHNGSERWQAPVRIIDRDVSVILR
jgi:hypothetical protein